MMSQNGAWLTANLTLLSSAGLFMGQVLHFIVECHDIGWNPACMSGSHQPPCNGSMSGTQKDNSGWWHPVAIASSHPPSPSRGIYLAQGRFTGCMQVHGCVSREDHAGP